jgi:3-deoxy-7-phosphoheptulonate synthase
MHIPHDDLRIADMRPLLPPAILIEEIPLSEQALTTIDRGREASANILHGRDDRLLVICGPCSIHDPVAALDYAQWLREAAAPYQDDLLVMMRTYFEKPRTVIGWKGLLNDPFIDGTFHINQGLRIGRKFLRDVCELGLPTATEFLDTINPQFLADAISWAAIGARTTESQIHRELASGLSMPIGFKNGTSGNLHIAIDAVRSARESHWFPSVTRQGVTAIFKTTGNPDAHIILRGGARTGPNFDAESVQSAVDNLAQHDLPPYLIVDCSHGNSQKDHNRQSEVADNLADQLEAGQSGIAGVMLESFLSEGRQDYDPAGENIYGKSITDACIGPDATQHILERLATAVQRRRQ